MFVDAIVFCETSMLHPWLCRHYSLKRCQNTCHTRYQWLLGPFRGTFVINSEMSLKKKKKEYSSEVVICMSFPCFRQHHYFWTSKYSDQHFLRKNCALFPNLHFPLSPPPVGGIASLNHFSLFFFFFSTFCLLFCQGSSNPVWCFSVLKFYRGICDCVNFPSLFPSPSRKPPRNKALWLIFRWKCKP